MLCGRGLWLASVRWPCDVGQTISYGSLTSLLTEANKLDAILDGRVIAHASSDPDGLRIAFSWLFHPRQEPDRQLPFLDVEVVLSEDSRPWHERNPMLARWDPSEIPGAVGARLVAQLRSAGLWSGQGFLDFGLALKNLHRTVEIALRSRRGDVDAWHLQGRVRELVDDRYVITDVGIEVPEQQFIQPAGSRLLGLGEAVPQPSAPDWADPAEWERALARRTPQRSMGMLMGGGDRLDPAAERCPWTGAP